jgi:hypothetical protein
MAIFMAVVSLVRGRGEDQRVWQLPLSQLLVLAGATAGKSTTVRATWLT